MLLLLASSPLFLGLAEALESTTAESQLINSGQDQFKPANISGSILTIGYLAAVKGVSKNRGGLAISGAMSMALEEVRYSQAFFILDVFVHVHSR